MSAMAGKKHGRSGCGACGIGCVGAIVVGAAVLAGLYSSRGHYQPYFPPPQPLPVPNALDDYIAAGRMLQANGGFAAVDAARKRHQAYEQWRWATLLPPTMRGAAWGPAPPPPGPSVMEVERRVVLQNQATIARLGQGLGKPCRVPAIRLPTDTHRYLLLVGPLARLLADDADICLTRHDNADAIARCLDAVQIAQDIERGGDENSAARALWMQDSIALVAIRAIDGLTGRDCERAVDRLRFLVSTRVPRREIVDNERARILSARVSAFDQMRGLPAELLGWERPPTTGAPTPPATPKDRAASAAAQLLWRVQRESIVRRAEQQFDELAAEIDKPATLRSHRPRSKDRLAYWLEPDARLADMLDLSDARVHLLLCALAIRSYQLHRGRLPRLLADVGLTWIETEDPYTGYRLRYEPTAAGYLLYAVGPDGRDVGGIPAWDDKQPGNIGICPCRREVRADGSKGLYRTVPHMLPPRQSATVAQ